MDPNNPDDKEMMDAFVEEVQTIRKDLDSINHQLKANVKQPKLFESWGQAIDRIYGTAATLGYKEFADYCLMMKGICYRCSQSDNMYAQNKVLEVALEAIPLIDRFVLAIYQPLDLKRMQYQLTKELTKVDALGKNALRNIRRASVA